jgi:hypothetical protein
MLAISTAIGLSTMDIKVDQSSHKGPSTIYCHNAIPELIPASPPTSHPTDTARKPKPSPLKEKITLFESLNRPATRAAATVRRRSGPAIHNLKEMASSTSAQIWRRLSGSFDREVANTSPPSHDSAGEPSRHRLSGKKRVYSTSNADGQHRGFEPRRNTRPSARESTFIVQGTISRVPRGVVSRQQQQHQQHQQRRTSVRRSSAAPSLPDLDFEVDGAADMLGYFEHEFDIHFSFTGPNESSGTSASTPSSRGDVVGGFRNKGENIVGPGLKPAYHPSNPAAMTTVAPAAAKSRASPVLSIRSPRGVYIGTSTTTASRPEIPPRNPDRVVAWKRLRPTVRNRPATPAPARNKAGGFADNRPPARRGNGGGGGGGGETDEEVVVSQAQCGLAHPRPSRVLDVRRFVGYCRETAGRGRPGLGKL